jgi:probable F420-dependent oxidoreductase
MRFGMWLEFRNPPRWRRPWHEIYQESLALATEAERLGFDSVWLSEHHLTEDGYLPSVFPALAAIAARTTRVRLGTAMLLAPLHHPLRLAEDVAVTDLLTDGRLELGLAAGYRRDEFDAFGVPRGERGTRTDETLAILRQAWSGRPFSFAGRHFRFENVTVTPEPYQRPYPPIWIGGGGQAAAVRAGRHGCRFLPDLGTPAEVVDVYRDTLVEHGHDPADFPITTIVSPGIYVCDDAKLGWSEVKEHYLYLLNTFRQWFGQPVFRSADELPRDLFLIGPPEVVADGLRERLAPFDRVERVLFFGRPPGLPMAATRRSLARLSAPVLPKFA